MGIVTFNTRDLTLDALGRLLDVAPTVPLRVLVHDNASTDGTPEAVRSRFPSVEVVESEQNLGFGAGMNNLIRRGSAPWFLALNSDAWPEPGAIEELVTVGSRDPSVGVVAPRLLRPDGSLEHSAFPFPSLAVAAITAVGGYRRFWPRTARRLALVGAWDHTEARDVDWAVGAALLMRRVTVEAVGGFDETFFMYAEDLEWCWRVRRAGWRIRFEPQAVVRHVGNASAGKTYGRGRNRAHIHNFYRFYRRSHGPVGTAAYRLVSIAGCARLYALARLSGDVAARAEWGEHLRAHAGRVSATDSPPAGVEPGPTLP